MNKDLSYIRKKYSSMYKDFGKKNILSYVKIMYPACDISDEKQVLRYFKKNRNEIKQKMKEEKESLENQWKAISSGYFKTIEETTGFNWKFKKYYCHVSSSYVCGGAYIIPDHIIVCPYSRNPISVIMHELFHLHLTEVIKEMNIRKSEQLIWKLSEIVTFLTLSKMIIKNVKPSQKFYPNLRPELKKARRVWKKDFRTSLLNVVDILD